MDAIMIKQPFIIAEIGGNHEGNFEQAKLLLDAASQTGADAVKFQIYRGEKIANKLISPERAEHFKKFELDDSQWMELIQRADSLGVIFMSSVWDAESLETYDPYIAIHKIGSGDLTAHTFLEHVARKDKPMILSTAMSTIEEIKEAVNAINRANPRLIRDRELVVLHCVAMYGDPQEQYANLLSIRKLQDEFPNLDIGYSDHTRGIYACELALAMGACVIEKHFTLDKTRAFRDHHLSVDPKEMKELVEKTALIKTYLGRYEKKPIKPIENEGRIREFRRGVYPRYDLKKGTVLTKDNTVLLRPNTGIGAESYTTILGKKLENDRKALEPLKRYDVAT